MRIEPDGLSIAGATHHRAAVNGTHLHYVTAGYAGSPILLVHGFPESWWTFHKLIPLLSAHHRVIAVDLRGFGDSAIAEDQYGSAEAAEDLHQLVVSLGLGPVHLTVQDISGASGFRLAAQYPADVRSYIAIESGLAGFGLEMLADVTHGGAWHIGAMAAPGVPELLITGREQQFLREYMIGPMCMTTGAFADADIDEFARTFAREGGWRGAAGLYRSMLTEGEDLQALAKHSPLNAPVLAIGAGGGNFTATSISAATNGLRSVMMDGVGHYAAMEAPERLALEILKFTAETDANQRA